MRRSDRTSSRATVKLQGADRKVTAGDEGAIGDAAALETVQREVEPIAPHPHAPHPLGLGDRRLVLGIGEGERRIGEVGREPGGGELDQGVGPQHQARGGEPRPVDRRDARVEHDAGRLEAGVLQRHRGAAAGARPPQVETHRGEGDLGDAKGGDAERPDELAHRSLDVRGVGRTRRVFPGARREREIDLHPAALQHPGVERPPQREPDQVDTRQPTLARPRHQPGERFGATGVPGRVGRHRGGVEGDGTVEWKQRQVAQGQAVDAVGLARELVHCPPAQAVLHVRVPPAKGQGEEEERACDKREERRRSPEVAPVWDPHQGTIRVARWTAVIRRTRPPRLSGRPCA